MSKTAEFRGSAELLSPYSTRKWVRVGYQTQMKSTQKHEMYMANAKILRWVPTTPIFH